MNDASHVPVLLERVLDVLAPALAVDRPVVVDATLGLGGHTEAMLDRFPDVHVIGIDRDPEALARAAARLAAYGDRVTFAHAVYDEIAEVVTDAGYRRVSAVLFDLGVNYTTDDFGRITLGVENVFNKQYILSWSQVPGFQNFWAGRGRMVSLSWAYTF